MKTSRAGAATLTILATAAATPAPAAQLADPIRLVSLLAEMDNLAALAEFPQPPFTLRQFSSYDRASTSPGDLSTWFYNGDLGHYLRVETVDGENRYVMMDAEGPGAIVRIWSANPGGVLRIYVDGSDTPAFEMSMQDAMDGKHEPFLAPFAGVHALGWNLYFPFPYATHCKVTTSAPNMYYHVNYRTYPPGTEVASFTMQDIHGAKDSIDPLGRRLAVPFASRLPPLNAKTRPVERVTLAPEASKTIAHLKGPGAVFELGAALRGARVREALRHTIVEITFDGGSKPQVVCPLGDFFGSSPDINPYESLPLLVHKSGELRSRWFMPFARSCRIEIKNRGSDPVDFEGGVTIVPYDWSERSMHFHAKWRAEHHMATRAPRDWTFVRCEGKGVFVGDMLSVSNPVEGWWGEGDEKIYVDGEPFPSHFGTGSEDYFGYAWCNTSRFTHCYHNQSRCDGPGNYGLTSLNRFHIVDKIPFTSRFQFDLEVLHSDPSTRVSYAATSYWYARPGGADFFQPLTKEMLEVVEPAPLPPPVRVAGALEGEELKIAHSTAITEVQEGFGALWSQRKQLWWRGGKPGDALVLVFSVPETGRYQVSGNFTKAVDYGILQLSIDDTVVGEPMDFYHDGVTSTGRTLLGTLALDKGEHMLKAEIIGKNPGAVLGHMFGLDYLLLETP